jgi:hypothetical protein
MLDHALELLKLMKDLGFVFKQINPSELVGVINKTNIVIIVTNRRTSRTPHIREDKL